MRDVVIVGGGPAGLYAALLLSRQGWDVALFEEHAAPGEPVHCTGVLASDAFDELDIPRDAILNVLSAVRLFAPSGDHIDYMTPVVEAVVIDRRRFDHALYEQARSAGVTIVTGARVIDAIPGRNQITLVTADGGSVDARACILACGANYTIQRRLGLGMPAVFLQTAQVECAARPMDTVEVHFGESVAPQGFAWVVPVRREGRAFARVGLMCSSNAGHHFSEFTRKIAPRWGIDRICGAAGDPPRQKMLPLAPIRRTCADRLLAIGDAAGLVKATTGGGIYYSLVSASIAADVLGRALGSDTLNEGPLSEYQRAWRKRLGPELQAQLALRQIAHRLTDHQIDELFELAQTNGIMPIVRRTARFNQHRDLIMSLFKHPPARRVFFRRIAQGLQVS